MKAVMFPGQGSQFKGMGKDLFKGYKTETIGASELLGYDLEELCLRDPQKLLSQTQYTQPAIYTVNSFAYFDRPTQVPSYLIGHSLGEYNALLASGVFDFMTGLKLVKKRGELMAAASGGGMAAVLGVSREHLIQLLAAEGFMDVDIANLNTPTQTVLSGPKTTMSQVIKQFLERKINIIPLNVSAPFHSRYMKAAADEFKIFLKGIIFHPLKIPVIANVMALPYSNEQIASVLSAQIAGPVQWVDSIRLLVGYGVDTFDEVNGTLLTKMTNEIRRECSPILDDKVDDKINHIITASGRTGKDVENQVDATSLGSKDFKASYRVKYSYVVGSMYRGISSAEMVIKLARSGILSFFGSNELPLDVVQQNVNQIQEALKGKHPFGVAVRYNPNDTNYDMQLIDLCLQLGVKNIEVSAYLQLTPALIRFKAKGMRRDVKGNPMNEHRIMAKVSRPEVAETFFQPPSQGDLVKLVEHGLITDQQAQDVSKVSIADDICVESETVGALVLLPSIILLQKQIIKKFPEAIKVRIGLSGGIGTPQAIACAYVLGADFVLTGSINQCTVEAGINAISKDLLQEIDIHDTILAPSSDFFEMGVQEQVVKKGTLFPLRARKLYTLYCQYNSLEEIPEKIKFQLERDFFKAPIAQMLQHVQNELLKQNKYDELDRVKQQPKLMLGQLFRLYLERSRLLPFQEEDSNKMNFQLRSSPALGAFNQFVCSTSLESWRNRYVDKIGVMLMEHAADILSKK
ncbi:ACP S-malonyltransferase [Dyadobacter tibetensis]|uniref:ACP S-malonyltransferase n=1 Tax=Dyadobacter tibetensis TaxID=1211851 RepID=UPI0005C605E1|nr:ACP S-malonyltransferase [Dyadobacter tibetensis]